MSKKRASASLKTGPASDFPSYQEPIVKKPRKQNAGSSSSSLSKSVTNYYDVMNQEKKYQTEEFHYPAEDQIHIKVPFMMSIVGKTGSGKTNFLMDLVNKINCWTKIFLCTKDPDEPLYKWFADKIKEVEKKTGEKIITVYDDVIKIPDATDFQKNFPRNKEGNRDINHQILFIFDDMITEKDKMLKKIEGYFIFGRKVMISGVILSQSYFKVPITIRKQCGYIELKHIAQESDLKRIIKDYQGLGVTFEKLIEMYQAAMEEDPFNVFTIDVGTKDENLRFRINYEGIPASVWKVDPHSSSSSSSSSSSQF